MVLKLFDFYSILSVSLCLSNYSEYWRSQRKYIKLPICNIYSFFLLLRLFRQKFQSDAFVFWQSKNILLDHLPRSTDECHINWIVHSLCILIENITISYLFQTARKYKKRFLLLLLLLYVVAAILLKSWSACIARSWGLRQGWIQCN